VSTWNVSPTDKGITVNAYNGKLFSHKDGSIAGCRWLMPVILATQEVEIRRIVVGSQPRQMVP
jgi:hypothetical protein